MYSTQEPWYLGQLFFESVEATVPLWIGQKEAIYVFVITNDDAGTFDQGIDFFYRE